MHLLTIAAADGTYPPILPAIPPELDGPLLTRVAAQGGRTCVYRHTGYTSRTWRSRHRASLLCRNIRLAYGNISGAGAPPYAANPNSITVSASVERSGLLIPVTFGGASTVVIAPGAVVISDPVNVWYASGSLFYVRSHHAVDPGQILPGCAGFSLQASRGEGWGTGDITTFGSVTTQNAEHPFLPLAIIGDVPADTTTRSWAFFGDSIGEGVTDDLHGYPSTGGFPERMGMASGVPWSNFAASGERFDAMSNWDARIGDTVASYFTDALVEYGINDTLVYGGMATASNYLNRWKTLRTKGFQRVYQTTTTPRTDGSLPVNTTPHSREAERAILVAWMRDGAPGHVVGSNWSADVVGTTGVGIVRTGTAPHPLTGLLDAETLAIAPGSLWKTGYSTDGLHPSPLGHQQITAGLAPLPA